jgi:glycosyltransferase involved in cell wall biosynthesis
LQRLLYVGDVPVEASYHGSALAHRLLVTYPADRLRVVESSLGISRAERRLPGVEYRVLDFGSRRWLDTRLHRLVSQFYALRAGARAAAIDGILDGFAPQAVLTVAHGYSWMAAARFARQRGLPLHMIVHDDWPRVAGFRGAAAQWLDREFGRIYRAAASRLCVSPYMAQDYLRRYGASASVLYPARAPGAKVYDTPPDRLKESNRPLVAGFGGTVNSAGYAVALRALGGILAERGGHLEVFGPLTSENAARAGLVGPGIRLNGLVKADEFVPLLRERVDLLFAPMSFAPEDADNMKLSFPSKLTDYTACGLPILVYGPEYASAVQWARTNPGVAQVVTDDAGPALREAVMALQSDPAIRFGLARKAIESGARMFSAEAAERTFLEALGRPAAGKY